MNRKKGTTTHEFVCFQCGTRFKRKENLSRLELVTLDEAMFCDEECASAFIERINFDTGILIWKFFEWYDSHKGFDLGKEFSKIRKEKESE